MAKLSNIPTGDAPPSGHVLPVVVAVLIFATLSLLAGFGSDAFLEADATLHYLYARFAIAEPYRFVDVWGRPICTAIYALPAALAGRTGTRIASLVLAIGVAWIAMRIAKRQGHAWPALALIFTLGQPLVFLHSFTELTELPFALLVGGAFLAYQSRQFVVMAALVSLTPLSRPEGFAFIFMAFVALVLHRKWWPILLLPIGLLGWDLAGWHLYGRAEPWYRWLPDHWPYAAESAYRPGYLLHFVASLPAIVSPLVFPATVVGIVTTLALLKGREGVRAFFADHGRRCAVLVALIPLSILIVHSILYWRGKMASNGELRYLLTVAPFWGVLAARGWEWAADQLPMLRRRVYLVAGIACLLPAVTNIFYRVLPLGEDRDNKIARIAATGLREHQDSTHPFIMAANPLIFYFLDVSPTNGSRVKDLNSTTIASPPAGTRLVWDSLYGQYNADRSRVVNEQSILAAGWIPDPILQAELDRLPPPPSRADGWNAQFHERVTEWRSYKSPQALNAVGN